MNKNRNKIAAMIIAGSLLAAYVPSGVYAADMSRSESKVEKKIDGVNRSEGSGANTGDDGQNSNQQSTTYGCFEVINEGATCIIDGNVLTISGEGNEKKVTISMNQNDKTGAQIVVKSRFDGTINLDGVNIETSAGAPFLIENGASPTIKIKAGTSSSFITSDIDCAGIELNGENANITINEKEGEWGSLTATSANDNARGAGIGSGNKENSGTIKINGGTVIATSSHGAGIGSSSVRGKSCKGISIDGGTVIATSFQGAGIGSGNGGNSGNITIKGGTVEATSTSGAGIGSSVSMDSSCTGISIDGGTVKATSTNGAGIGSVIGGSCKSIFISGGSVKSKSVNPIPKNKEDGETVYLVELEGQNDFGSVEVDGKDYNVSDNNKNNDGTIDTTLYLYMPKGNHSIKTNNGWYVLELKENGQGNVVLNGDITKIEENITEKLKNLSGYRGSKLSSILLPSGFEWKDDTTKLEKSEKYEAKYTLKGVEYPIFIDISVKESTGGGGSYIPPTPTYDHTQIIGSDRYETAGLIADKLGSYDTAVLVNAESSMSDGLSASGLAGKENGAILLTKKDFIPKATMDRLKKVKKVYIIGEENAISKKVYDEITKNVPNVKIERLGGKTRVETSEIVAKEIGSYDKAFVVNGFNGEADAMSASSVAAREESPILLTNGKTSTHSKKAGVEYYVVGGNTVVDKAIAEKYDAEILAGDDRYETNKEVIAEFYSGSDTLYFANGETLVDALTASTIAKEDGLVLVGRNSDNEVLNKKNTIQVGGMEFDVDFEK